MIGAKERLAIAELMLLAEANPIEALKAAEAAERDLAGYRDMMGTLSIDIPVGYHVTFSHEIQPSGLHYKHISISIDRPGRMPHPVAVDMILEAFEMRHIQDMREGNFWIEEETPTCKAINVLQRVST